MKRKFLSILLSILMIIGTLNTIVIGTETHAEEVPRYVESGKTYLVGDRVLFGHYWQNDTNGSGKADMNDAKESIVWRVLSQNGDDLFIMSEEALDWRQYNTSYEDVTWEDCTLREWLNGTFYDDAFSNEEKNAILTTQVVNEINPVYETIAGNDTYDRIFILSLSEATDASYGFSANKSEYDTYRRIHATYFAMDNGDRYLVDRLSTWWLRSPGKNNNHLYKGGYGKRAAYVVPEGNINNDGSEVIVIAGVCPAMHINLSLVPKPTPSPSITASPTCSPGLSTPTSSNSSSQGGYSPKPTASLSTTAPQYPMVSPSASVSPSGLLSETRVLGDYKYVVKSDNTAEIAKYLGSSETIIVPAVFNGYKVTSVGDYAFAHNNTLKDVTLPKTVTRIGKHAFDSCVSLEAVDFYKTLKTIEEYAFFNCPKVHAASLLKNITFIGNYAFGYDSSYNVDLSFAITGYPGTAAQLYAEENGIQFININNTTNKKSVKFIRKSITIRKGKTATLKVKITGAKKATFTTNKKKVVKIINKKAKKVKVKGMKKGYAVITAKVGSKKAKCGVIVKANNVRKFG